MRIAGIMLVLMVGLAMGQSPAPEFPKAPSPSPTPPSDQPKKSASVSVRLSELEDFVVKTDKLIVNNLCVTQDPCTPGQGLMALRMSACYRSRVAESQAYCVMIVGLDENKDVLWAGNMKGMTDPSASVGVMQDAVLVPVGMLKSTTTLQVRVYTADSGQRYPVMPVVNSACSPPALQAYSVPVNPGYR